ncbi:hypothetical protein [Nostoc sp.]|uniref:hypothetical protein n=1 Tax=Nostoc sp. TaxID=1180 RepID=UPI002FF9245C
MGSHNLIILHCVTGRPLQNPGKRMVEQQRYTLEQVCGIDIRETDFTDDRFHKLRKMR